MTLKQDIQIISIVTRLPPSIDGVGDYSLQLALNLRRLYSIETCFIVGDPLWQGSSEIQGFSVFKIDSRESDSLLSLLHNFKQKNSLILLQYAPHGYQKRACAFWLIEALTKWKNNFPKKKLVTMFHEIYALAWQRPWSSDFYLSPLQQNLASKLVNISDTCITSSEKHAEIIHRYDKNKRNKASILPIPSAFGESNYLLPLNKRERRLILFGNAFIKRGIYKKHHRKLKNICKNLEIKEIWDIGTSVELNINSINNIAISKMGYRSYQEISEIISHSLIGVLNHNPNRLATSSIFGAYSANGMLTVNLQSSQKKIDNLVSEQHYLSMEKLDSGEQSLSSWQTIVDNANVWYKKHCWSAQADTYASILSLV